MNKKHKRSAIGASAPSFEVLTICWSDRTVTYAGRVIQAGPENCLALPIFRGQITLSLRDSMRLRERPA